MEFNLIDEPFILCAMSDGGCASFGLRETLVRADEIREIRDGSPLVTLALHRLLLAILHRNFGPKNPNEWKPLWEDGRFDAVKFDAYFQRWRQRFDLFDDERPFFQTGKMTTDKPLPVAALFEELACNNNATLFDHCVNDSGRCVSAAAAARGLIARQGFALGLGVSPDVLINGKRVKTGHRKDGPLARGLMVLVRGDNLFQTLMLNLSQYTPSPEDVPIWERDDPEAAVGEPRAAGRVDLYTFQCRRMRLETDGGSSAIVRVHFAQGREVHADDVDPMKPYRRDEKRGWVTFGVDENRALWRDSSALLELSRDPDRPIAALNWVARLTQYGVVPRHAKLDLDAFAVGTQPGKATSVILWRQDRMPLPVEYLDDASLVGNLKTALSTAEDIAGCLRGAVWSLVAAILAPDQERRPDTDRVRAMVDSLAAERLYWSPLENSFQRFLTGLPGDQEHRRQELAKWANELKWIAVTAFRSASDQFDNSPRAWRASSLAAQKLNRDLFPLLQPFKEHHHAAATNG